MTFFPSSGLVRESVAKSVEEEPSAGSGKVAATVRLLVKLIFLALILVGLLFGYQVRDFFFVDCIFLSFSIHYKLDLEMLRLEHTIVDIVKFKVFSKVYAMPTVSLLIVFRHSWFH